MEAIRFGTSGWRGIVGQDITFRNVRLVLDATAEVLRRRGARGEVLVSYDTRLLSEKLAREAVAVLTHHGFATVTSERDLPSPCLAHATRARGAALGVMFTASHNPPEYNGVKLFTRDGTAVSRELTDAIEAVAVERADTFPDFFVPQRHLATSAPLTEGYLASLDRDVDWEAITASRLEVAVDPLFGTAREFLDRVLIAHGVPTHVLHTTKDPYFGGYAPECSPQNLGGLRELLRSSGAALGLATDGDADRFGVIDRGCRVVSPNLAIALLVDYLVRRRGVRGGVARTIGTTRMVDRVAAAVGCEVIETPVGFGSFGPLFVDSRIAIAAEESAGLGVASHLPERDGIFAALLVAEMVAVERSPLRELIRRLFARFGPLLSRRIQLPATERTRAALERIRQRTFPEFAGYRVVREDRQDGLLLEVEGGGWVLMRAAGTEAKVRLYAEGTTSRQLRDLVCRARRMFAAESEEG